jgi:hypothetical protein
LFARRFSQENGCTRLGFECVCFAVGLRFVCELGTGDLGRCTAARKKDVRQLRTEISGTTE